jgi:uncharacterized membrane protein YeaQ/YmgE (transglycosylase-associated protein family)
MTGRHDIRREEVHRLVTTTVLKVGSVDGFNLESIVIATLGAIAVVFIASFVTGSRKLGSR